jgi:hypothetical protein
LGGEKAVPRPSMIFKSVSGRVKMHRKWQLENAGPSDEAGAGTDLNPERADGLVWLEQTQVWIWSFILKLFPSTRMVSAW